MRLFDSFSLGLTPTHATLTPPKAAADAHLRIDRTTGAATVVAGPPPPPAPGATKRPVFGILGVVRTEESGPLLLTVSKRVRQGEVLGGNVVYRLEAAEVVALRNDEGAEAAAKTLTDMLNAVLCTPYFYFSYSMDLTQTRQRSFIASATGPNKTALEKCDQRFVWNRTLLEPLLGGGATSEESAALLSSFLLPVIHGAVFINKCTIHGKSFSWSLISRRSRHMVGTRFFARGCDSTGRVANFVETEQLVEFGTSVASFVQTRGSMPMFWQQVPNIRYKPNPVTIPGGNHISGLMNHFKEQIPIYGEQVVVNLIDQKKAEGELELTLRNLVSEAGLKEVHYLAFDFHKECSKMRYDRLSILMGKCQDFLSDFGYFCSASSSAESPIQLQKGVFRTNCIDCLDRTNVVQSLLATENLKVVLKRFGILTPADDIFKQTAFQSVYKNAWADHADMISVQYAGTGALKTDFTRTGKRTRYGLLQDGWNAANRYYLNNFMDGDRTDALRLFSGEVGSEEALNARRAKAAAAKPMSANLPLALLVCLIVMVSTLLFSSQANGQFFMIVGFTSVLVAVIWQSILNNGKTLVNFPATKNRLAPGNYGR